MSRHERRNSYRNPTTLVAVAAGTLLLAACASVPKATSAPSCELYKNASKHYSTPDVLTGSQIPHTYPNTASVTVGYPALLSTTDTAQATIQKDAHGNYLVTPSWHHITAPNPRVAELTPVNSKGFSDFAADITFSPPLANGITDIGVNKACMNATSDGHLASITLPHS